MSLIIRSIALLFLLANATAGKSKSCESITKLKNLGLEIINKVDLLYDTKLGSYIDASSFSEDGKIVVKRAHDILKAAEKSFNVVIRNNGVCKDKQDDYTKWITMVADAKAKMDWMFNASMGEAQPSDKPAESEKQYSTANPRTDILIPMQNALSKMKKGKNFILRSLRWLKKRLGRAFGRSVTINPPLPVA